MTEADVIVVGGGPAGSSCAWQLNRLGVECLILDKQAFPRTKLCAGWITPEAVQDLELDIGTYPHRFYTFSHMHFHFPGFGIKSRTVQHSIRRFEFDDWLLKRAGVPVHTHEVRTVRRDGGFYILDDAYRCKYLVGAGGTSCPVFRNLFREANPRAKTLQAVTLEEEFPYRWADGDCHLWFFGKGLPGYSWYVPKADGYLNVGIGAMAARLKQRNDDIRHHWDRLVARLERLGLVGGYGFKPKGYSYYLHGEIKVGRLDNAFIAGDAAGLATRDLCEGIGPAVRSGIMAAEAIAKGGDYSLETLNRYSGDSALARGFLEYMFHRRGAARG